MITWSSFKGKVSGKMRGASLAKVDDPEGKAGEAAGNVLLRLDPPTTKRRQRIENAIYSHIYNYTAPTDLKGEDSILDLRPIGERSPNDSVEGTFGQEFDIKKKRNSVAVETINATPTLRISKILSAVTTLFRGDSLTLEGTVTASGDVSDLEVDTLDYVAGSGSIKFALSGVTGAGAVTIALTNSIDLSTMYRLGALFEWFKFPDVSRLNSVTLRWGSGSGVYWSKTVTAAHDRSFTEVGNDAWMLLRNSWTDASETGGPTATDAAAIDYLQISFSYDIGVALEGAGIDSITASLGKAYEVLYYSDCLFRGADGTYKTQPTADTDVILLNGDGVNILLYEYMLIIAQEVKGKAMAVDVATFTRKLEGTQRIKGLYELFEAKYPSEAIVRQTTYHTFDSLDGYGDGSADDDDD